MKDLVFSGSDVETALASAAANLGLPASELRYVVLEAGTPGARGLKPTPARIAVLLPGPAARDEGSEPEPRQEPERHEGRPAGVAPDARAGVRAVVRALAEAAAIEIDCEIDETAEALIVQLRGPGCDFFYGEDGKGEPLRALEHLAQRMYAASLHPLTLRVRCEGFRERRDEALGSEARRLAAAVRTDGVARTLEPMNSYERRIVHIALQDEPGVTTYSVGEGPNRRVTIAQEGPGAAGGGSADGD